MIVPWLHQFDPHSTDTDIDLAVAISKDPKDGHWHAGIVFRDADDQLHLLHLGWHRQFWDEAPSKDYSYVDLQLEPDRLAQLAALCEAISERYANQPASRSIPYALRYDKTRFDATGTMVLGTDEFGLTCATFPLAVFESGAVQLVELNSWPVRPEDRVAQEKILKLMHRTVADAAHLAKVRAELGCIRVQPQETAGACACPPYPCDFSRARAAADQIEAAFAGR